MQIKAETQIYALAKLMEPVDPIIRKISKITKDVHKDFFIAGGAITSAFMGQKPRDIDIFCTDEIMVNELKKYLKQAEATFGKFSESKRAVTFTTSNNIYQFIKSPTGKPQTIIDNFDFTICMGAWSPYSPVIIHGERFLMDLSARRLVVNKLQYPIGSLFRMLRFLKRGFRMSSHDIIKLVVTINALSIGDWQSLKDQTNGYLSCPDPLDNECEDDAVKRSLEEILDLKHGVLGSRLDPANTRGMAPELAKEA